MMGDAKVSKLEGFSLTATNFKCFGDDPQGFEHIRPINLIIGRNNSGKSSLLDLIGYATEKQIEVPERQWHNGKRPAFFATSIIEDADVTQVFRKDTRGGGIPGHSHYEFGAKLVGLPLKWRMDASPGERLIEIPNSTPLPPREKNYYQQLADRAHNPMAGKEFCRILAERNITPETDKEGPLTIGGDGHGATNVIQHFINKANLSSELVEVTMLEQLNNIFAPDAFFRDIVCQQLSGGEWEIFLDEEGKGRIPLSQSGSGLKTIILVLCYMHLFPVIKGKPLGNFVFAFEELENNLHPSLLRRLLTYLKHQCEENNAILFLTTHSNIAIDLFGKDGSAQIVHVTHNGVRAAARATKTYIDNKGILDDLDVRASDILQSNGIIWVEGPSDRIYLNRWLSIWAEEELVEGTHYQCVFYGGRLLSHLSSKDPDVVEEAVSILRVNRHAILMMDSDKRKKMDRLTPTKKRIIKELNHLGGTPWVTKGREVENYIPAEAVAKWLGESTVAQCEQYEGFFDYLERIAPGTGRRLETKKPLLAEQLVPFMNRQNVEQVLDLNSQLNSLCKVIRSWNRM